MGLNYAGGALDDRAKDDRFSDHFCSINLKSVVRMNSSGIKVGRLRCGRRVGDKRGWTSAKPASSKPGLGSASRLV